MRSSTEISVMLLNAMFVLGVFLCTIDALSSTTDDLARLAQDKNYVDVSNFQNVRVSLRYASEDNFMGKNIYGEFHSCLLHRVAADKFRVAARVLQEERPGWKFLIFDCLRPRSLQEKLFAVVKGTAQQP